MSIARARLAALGGTVVLALALAACGVPVSGSPRAISKSDLPAAPAAATTTTAPPADEVAVIIVLLDSATNAPSPVLRYAPQQSDRLQTVLTDLLLGPAPGSETLHLTSAIPSSTRLIGVSPNPLGTPGIAPSGPVTVNLSADFIAINGPSQVLAVEQVVFTVACDLTPVAPPTTRVFFEVDGVAQDVPIANGTSVSRPVTAADYGPLSCTT